jgi:hypothetical protein
MKNLWLILIGFVILAASGLLGMNIFSGATVLVATPLELKLSEKQTTFDFQVGSHKIKVVLEPMQEGDNGAVAVKIFKNGSLATTTETQFNYDMWTTRHPAIAQFVWFDSDALPDLRLELSDSVVVIQSSDGRVIRQ